MSDSQTSCYEGMFLFPQASAANMQGAVDHLKTILDRADAEIISLRKWDERRLAYEINGNKRGLYFLVYFRVDGSRITGIERDCNLSEELLRTIILRAEHLTLDQMQAADGQAELDDEIRLRQESAEAEAPKETAAVAVATETVVVTETVETEAPPVPES